ncbi:MAG: 30S ribosomal protein S9 [Candidatus Omnitrophica bacterium]|nr:30S ribosomal protein S9 [Candidatus Omnitrophota bacterium]
MNTYYATGRRKESVARVWLMEGEKGLQINERNLENYFPREAHRTRVQEPLKTTNFLERFGVKISVQGGGTTGQAAAIRLGIARALVKVDENLRPVLRKSGFLTRDPRAKERKKYGRKGARRSFQYTKR